MWFPPQVLLQHKKNLICVTADVVKLNTGHRLICVSTFDWNNIMWVECCIYLNIIIGRNTDFCLVLRSWSKPLWTALKESMNKGNNLYLHKQIYLAIIVDIFTEILLCLTYKWKQSFAPSISGRKKYSRHIYRNSWWLWLQKIQCCLCSFFFFIYLIFFTNTDITLSIY